MSRDHTKLRVFTLADGLVIDVYRHSTGFPRNEQQGLVSQLRRAAVSTASNIVEGSARRTTREYVSFLNVATGSAFEARYLIDLSCRLGFLEASAGGDLVGRYNELARSLVKLVKSLENLP